MLVVFAGGSPLRAVIGCGPGAFQILRRLLPGLLIRHGGPAGLPLAEREDEGVQAPAQALLGRIVQRVGIATKRVQPAHLPTQGVVADVAKQRGFGRHRVQRLAAGHGEPLGQGSAQHEVVHEPAGHVVAGGGHMLRPRRVFISKK